MSRWFAELAAAAGRRHGAATTPAVRPASRRRAPRALAWAAVGIVVLQFGLGTAAELYTRIRDPLYGDKLAKLRRRVEEPTTDPLKVVMFGSSRTGLAFHGLRVEERLRVDLGRPVVAFNYGIPAAGPVTELVYVNRLLADGITPDLVLLEVLPSTLAEVPNGPLERHWFFADRLRYSEQAIVIRHGFDPSVVHERWWRTVLLPWYMLRFPVLTRIVPSWVPLPVRTDWSSGADPCGWGQSPRQQPTQDERATGFARARLEYEATLATLTPGGPAADALRELLALCKARGVAVRLVLMPESAAFRAFYSPAVSARLDAFMKALSAEYAVPVIDARQWVPDDQFTDGHHLLVVGAETFSDRMTREVIEPFLHDR
ncbi:hypothetical protein FRUB_02568 [Fimbriiglobus ruber]|uniref:Uncharacterized protein n=1 Tax=Fimbriiglobus ruber TaxID=1908690 RepID=A0A225E0E6_9BACT|nr:hypothetical protein FRUB_02568 [Fimbriiglobus ruber]